MTKYGSDQVAFLLLDGYNLLGVTTKFEDNVEVAIEDTTPLGVGWVTQDNVGEKKAEFIQDGFFDDASASINAACAGREGNSRILAYGLEGNTRGKRFTAYLGALTASWNRVMSRGQLHKCSSKFSGSGRVVDGVILAPHDRYTANGTTPVDNSAATAAGGVGVLEVTGLNLGGSSSGTIKIQHSTDNVSFTDLVTFDNVTAAPGAQYLYVAGTINRYLKVVVTFNGAGSGQYVDAMIGFARY